MTKTELIAALATKLETSKRDAGVIIDAVLDEIMHQVANGEKVTVPGFGTFEPVYRAARAARNPATGDAVEVPAKVTPKFTPGATFKNTVNA